MFVVSGCGVIVQSPLLPGMLEIGPPSSRRNVGPCPHYIMQDADRDVVVDRENNCAMAGEHGQHWSRGERSFGHG